jgi:hypothetical protein
MCNHNFLFFITTDWPQNCYFLNAAQLLVPSAHFSAMILKLTSSTGHANEEIYIVPIPLTSIWSPMSAPCYLLNFCLISQIIMNHLLRYNPLNKMYYYQALNISTTLWSGKEWYGLQAAISSFVLEGADSSTMSSHSLPETRWKSRLLTW